MDCRSGVWPDLGLPEWLLGCSDVHYSLGMLVWYHLYDIHKISHPSEALREYYIVVWTAGVAP